MTEEDGRVNSVIPQDETTRYAEQHTTSSSGQAELDDIYSEISY